jgi:hypothetical protein
MSVVCLCVCVADICSLRGGGGGGGKKKQAGLKIKKIIKNKGLK